VELESNQSSITNDTDRDSNKQSFFSKILSKIRDYFISSFINDDELWDKFAQSIVDALQNVSLKYVPEGIDALRDALRKILEA